MFLGPSLLKAPVQLFTFCKNCPLQASINDPLPVFYAIALAIFQESKEEECIIKMFQRSFAIMVKMLQRGIIFKGWILRMIKNRSCSWQHQAETDSDLYIANHLKDDIGDSLKHSFQLSSFGTLQVVSPELRLEVVCYSVCWTFLQDSRSRPDITEFSV